STLDRPGLSAADTTTPATPARQPTGSTSPVRDAITLRQAGTFAHLLPARCPTTRPPTATCASTSQEAEATPSPTSTPPLPAAQWRRVKWWARWQQQHP